MLIGQGFRTVPVLIYTEFISEMGGDTGFAAAVSLIVIAIAITVFLVQRVVANRMSFTMNALNPIQPQPARSPLAAILAHASIYLFTLLTMLPQLYVAYTSFRRTNGRVFADGFSLQSYEAALAKSGNAIVNTLSFSLAAVAIIVVIAVLSAYVTVRRRGVATTLLDVILMLPFIVPGSVLGIALLVTFNSPPLALTGTAAIMIIGFVIRRLPYTVRAAAAMLHNANESVEEAAISLGASAGRTFVLITLPMILAGIVAGADPELGQYHHRAERQHPALHDADAHHDRGDLHRSAQRQLRCGGGAVDHWLTALTVALLFVFFRLTGQREMNI